MMLLQTKVVSYVGTVSNVNVSKIHLTRANLTSLGLVLAKQ